METLLSACLGLGLAAACGFRVFVPLLVVSIAARTGHLALAERFDWIGGDAALVALAVATALEIGAYYLPWLDQLLDVVSSPAAVVAGVLVTASVVTGMDPFLKWTLAVIAGGGLAGGIQALTTGARGVSTLATAGLANPVVASVEAVGAVGLSLLALALPLLALLLVVLFLGFAWARLRRRRRRAAA